MRIFLLKRWTLLLIVGASFVSAQSLVPTSQKSRSATALQKVGELNGWIERAERAGVDALKEKMTVRTAEVFLRYADWDEANLAANIEYFKQVKSFASDAEQRAVTLPEFERQEVISMLDSATETLRKLIDGTWVRKPARRVDWSEVAHEGDQLSFEGRPVFLTDWTWKPNTEELDEFFGQQDGFFLMHSYVQNSRGEINPRIVNELKHKPDGSLGFIFLNHKSTPQWATHAYGAAFPMREDTYTAYDIDHPGARELNRLLLAGTVPYFHGKKYSQLGYMLCNEPHFYTTEGAWATGPVSSFTLEKFRKWLAQRHGDVLTLNRHWGSSFASFEEVSITIPISSTLQGSARWFDWVSFNMDRVTDWYRFLKGEIRSHDPSAKVHLKIMPNLWTDNKRNHGIDLEALTRLSDIIGNDAGAASCLMWGEADWQARYAFDWREMSMGHDFMKSVSPHKIMYNTESHFLSTGRSRDLKMNPRYARATFWLAYTQGLTVSQNWFWARNADGSIRSNAGNGYAGSNNQQPRIVNEVHSTLMDLNTYAEEIMAMQRQRKAIRIFYTKASAINKPAQMDEVFELYESLFFDGIPLGFVTRDILRSEDSASWDVILVRKTEFATRDELLALQEYVDAGGRVIVDGVSLKKDEYGQPLPPLTGDVVGVESLDSMRSLALRIVDQKGGAPAVNVTETNSAGIRGCTWKCIENAEGNDVLSIVNVGKQAARIELTLSPSTAPATCTNLLTGERVGSSSTLRPYEVLFVEVAKGLRQP